MARFRVLLAGCGAALTDLHAAQAILKKRGFTEVTVTDQPTRALLSSVDVALVQVKESDEQTVDAFALLQQRSAACPPIAVIVSGHSDEILTRAVQLGALDILQSPISEQADQLLFHVAKWRRFLNPQQNDAACDYSSGQASDCARFSPALPLPHISAPVDEGSLELLGSATSSGTVFDGDWAQSEALAAEIMPTLFGDEDSFSDTSALDVPFAAFESCEADLLLKQLGEEISQTQPSGSSDCSVAYLPSMRRQASFATCGASLGKRKSDDRTLSCELADDARCKKQKVEWTPELHNVFVGVIERIGVDKAVPSQILTEMGAAGRGLTRQNIASHLQKYRNRSRTGLISACASSGKPDAAAASTARTPAASGPLMMSVVPTWPTVAPSYAGWSAMAATPPVTVPLVPAATAVTQPSPQLLASLQAAMREPSGKPPIGLKLDAAAVLSSWNAARC